MLKAKRALPEHGRHVFAYRNLRTNHVVYSLDRILQNNAALKQLPDIGANFKPPKLRKDMWKPLWTLALPKTSATAGTKEPYRQGLEVFRKLREYRKLHELNWTPPADLSRPRTEKEIEEIQTKLDERGGSKKETPFDIIKRQKKLERARLVMNQRANSVADLAAILLEQETLGDQVQLKQQRLVKQDRLKELEEMFELATKATKQKIDEEMTRLQGTMEGSKEQKRHYFDLTLKKRRAKFALHQLEKAKAELTNMSAREQSRHKELLEPIISSLRDLARKLKEGRLDIVRENIRNLVAESKDLEAKGEVLSEEQLIEHYDLHVEKAQLRLASKVLEDVNLAEEINSLNLSEPAKQYECQWHHTQWTIAALQLERDQTPSLQQSLEDTLHDAEQKQKEFDGFSYDSLFENFPVESLEATHAPAKSTKAGEARNRMKEQFKPIFTTEGIKVHWENPQDPFYAEEWPESMEHISMPAVRHTAPDPTREEATGEETVGDEANKDEASVKTVSRRRKPRTKHVEGARVERTPELLGIVNSVGNLLNAQRKKALAAERKAKKLSQQTSV